MNPLPLLEALALLALTTRPDADLSASKISEALKPSVATLKGDLAAALAGLVERGFVEKLPRAPRQRGDRWRATSAGREALVAQLGTLLPTSARGAAGKAARALAAAHALGIAPRLAALLATEADALPTYLLARQLGHEFHPGITNARSLAREAAAKALAAGNTQPATLWRSIFQSALAAGDEMPAPVGDTKPAPEADDSPADSHPREPARSAEPFVQQLRNAARLAPEAAWFGSRKLFIYRAWEAWRTIAAEDSDDLAAFKKRLLAALRAGDVGLTRADFTATLNPGDLAASELRDGTETFHFITAERFPQP